MAKHNPMGLISGNLKRHMRRKHDGVFVADCDVCTNHLEALNRTGAHHLPNWRGMTPADFQSFYNQTV